MINTILMMLPFFFLFNEALLAAEAKPSIAIIDRIQIVGNAKISGEELAKSLDIPLNKEVFGPEMSEILMESERRLKASGKYKNDLTIKLIRSKKFPHFTIEAQLQEVDRWYFGADGSYTSGPAFLGQSEDRAFKYQRQSLTGQFYYGSRDYDDHGLAVDFEWTANTYGILGGGDSQEYTSNYKYRNLQNGLTASLIQKRFLHDYIYAGIVSRAIHSRAWNSSESSYSTDNNKKISRSLYYSEVNNIAGTIEPVFGIRINKVLLGGKVSRTLTRHLKYRDDSSETSYIDGIEQPSTTQNDQFNTPDISFDNKAELSFIWSDKSQLTVIEPGLDLHATWSRYYTDSVVAPPTWFAHAEYTILVSDQLASTILLDGEWRYRQPDEWQTKLERIIDLGLRFDYVTRQQIVTFAEFYRVGGKRNELRGSHNNDHLILDNRINVGLKYASPSLIYSLSFCYGSPIAGEYFSGSGTDSVYKRLGLR